MDARYSELLFLIQENRRVHCAAAALRHEVRQTHSSQSRIPHALLFRNGVNTNKPADDNTDLTITNFLSYRNIYSSI
jgi:hypothetical protein